MPETESDYLSIGEVLGLLVEEFPEVTISKIRFLESQGLINPERTTSGYRKFHDIDVELLRVILSEQRENYLPLRVIKDRIDSGEIDPSKEISRPLGIERPSPPAEGADTKQHPSARSHRPATDQRAPSQPGSNVVGISTSVQLDRTEFRSMTGLTEQEITELESFGIISPRRQPANFYSEHEVAIGASARILLRHGIDARHLRNWRTTAERELSLIEQLLAHQIRQRDPATRVKARDRANEISDAGAKLRSALLQSGIQQLFE